MVVNICRITNNETVVFASAELVKYLSMIDPTLDFEQRLYKEYRPKEGTLWLLEGEEGLRLAPKVEDPSLDDAYAIRISGTTGYIAATNPVSVLIAAYAFLKTLGCKWIRPGKTGEIIPAKKLETLSTELSSKASYRFRGVASSISNQQSCCLDFIEWYPKVGFNNYYIEGYEPPYTSAERDRTDAFAFFEQLKLEARRRGLKRHAVGHGWTMLAAGFEDLSKYWVPDADLTEEQRSCFAMIGGRRQLYHQPDRAEGMLSGSQLCYSQKRLRDRMIDDIVKYIKKEDGIDYLHFWLADGVNNHCECEECVKMRPSDWYILTLNELDKRLTEEGITSRIVCLIYVDLLWLPAQMKLSNPDRFILMFAPITRTYDTTYAQAEKTHAEMKPYVRNKLEYPRTAAENCAYLKAWQEEQIKGDSFIFDYHLMWNQYKAPGYRNLSRVIHDDMKALRDIGLSGSISCDIARCQIPHNFLYQTMSSTLWNREVDYDAEERAFFEDNYGEDHGKAFEYLNAITEAFSVIYAYYDESVDSKPMERALAERTEKAVAEILPVILENLEKESLHPAVKLSWELLYAHTELVVPYAHAYTAKYQNDDETGRRYFEEYCAVCDKIGEKYPKFFDADYAKHSVDVFYNEITQNGANVLLV